MRTRQEAIEWIHSLLPFGIKPGLARMEWMLERLDHPEREMKAIHIAGTNGKGSTVSYLRHLLEAGGYRVGTFTSPYIECFEERISVNGVPISEEDLLHAALKVRPLVEELTEADLGSPTEFEVITTMMFWHFARVARPDFCVVEVGLGGRYDSTNVLTPLVSAITMIGHDHMHILGASVVEIAAEKAGIIKKGVPLVTGSEDVEALEVIERTAKEQEVSVKRLHRDFHVQKAELKWEGQSFSYRARSITLDHLITQMLGEHQLKNAGVALEMIRLLEEQGNCKLSESAIRRGLAATSWPGRFETLATDPLLVADGAHNVEGVTALAATLVQAFKDRRYHFIVAATKEKDMGELLAPVENLDADFTFTTFDFHRAASERELYTQATVEIKRMEKDWRQALQTAQAKAEANTMIVVTGSLYFISEVRRFIKGNL
ncbi:bifunctional folylpolyglutamate synthase/dihydrofolate synthase [Shouchella shacheensis]|uniref:bifunctional folylpolyglutamate synthase/dihydrofolate synthase n=1 Tax=Shouchella shacheensis TaxID=1649580 RepID=UPI00073FF245|nr:folylpolyglutamate synthase/dihydrofolate synthase family protein [Shouchella shacheensis]